MNHYDEAILAAKDVFLFFKKYLPVNFNALDFLQIITKKERIFIEKRLLMNKFCGMLIIDEDEKTILLNDKHTLGKKLFTIGHELGHYFMHRQLCSYFLDQNGNIFGNNGIDLPLIEQQANAFSSELLMPHEVISAMLESNFSFYRIAKTLKVSYESLKWRLVRYCIETFDLNNSQSIYAVDDYIKLSQEKKHYDALIFYLDSAFTRKGAYF